MKLSLVVQNAGKTQGQAIPIKLAQFVIGRDPGCNLRPASAMISKRHCAVLVKEGKVFLRDFGSTNGSFVNDKPVQGEVPLNNGDQLKIGPLLFKVAIEKTAPVSKPTPPPPVKSPAAPGHDDDAAALLLSMEDGTSATTDTAESEIPGGSTIMEMPAFNRPEGAPEEGEAKPAAKKPEEKPKQHDSAQQAAMAILDKMRRGQRAR
jgi:predicted component of type VI protein secretion system